MATLPSRNLRVEPELWERASARARAEGTTVSEVIREHLLIYADGDPESVDAMLADIAAKAVALRARLW
jgi:hypothetical protein